MRTAVVYYSRYGATEQYAKWIAAELGADLILSKKCKIKDLQDYDTIIYGGGIYSGGIRGIELITDNWDKGLSEKRVICFGVGIAVDNEANQKQALEINFGKRFVLEKDENGEFKQPENWRDLLKEKILPIPCYFLPGAFDPNKLTRFDRGVIKLTRKMMAEDPANAKMLNYMEQGCNLVDRDAIAPIIEAVNR